MNEWTDIKGQEGKYQMCTDGRIRSMPHFIPNKNGRCRRVPVKVLELKVDEILTIKQMLAQGHHVIWIAEQFGISRKMVSKIKSGRSDAWLNK